VRNRSLDGLRGIAALIVVCHHILLTDSWIADRVRGESVGGGLKGRFVGLDARNIIEYSPLHFFYAGGEAVIVFFVLSGYVLGFAIQKSDLRMFLSNRVIRLWTPIAGAAIVSSVLLAAVPRREQTGQSTWLKHHVGQLHIDSVIRNIWCLDGTSPSLNSSLWSMRYEIIFSMAIIVLAGINFRKKYSNFLFGIVIIYFAMGTGIMFHLDLLTYLPMFFSGTALHWLPENSRFTGLRVLLGVVVIVSPWYFVGFGYPRGGFTGPILTLLGAIVIVDGCRIPNTRVSKFLNWKPISLAGRYSYSLYLIHAPVLETVWFAMGQPKSSLSWFLHLLVSTCAITISTILIYKIFESPSLKFIYKRNIIASRA